MKTFKEFIVEKTITNVNIGVNTKNTDLIKDLEGELDSLGVYYDTEGSDKKTRNFNVGFHKRKDGEKFGREWGSKVDFIEVETLDI